MSSSCFQTRRGSQITTTPTPTNPPAPPVLYTPARAHL
ncbi:hypothetical protein PSPO01_08560 [Paraphaeosphaeria sporulosa]